MCLLSQLLSKVTVTSCRSSAGILHGCLQQDGAPYLRRKNVTFMEHHMWPPNSMDLNPVDCAAWGALQQMVYQCRQFKIINQLKQAVVTELRKQLERFIDGAIGQWRHWLEWVVPQRGTQIKHVM